MSRASTTTTGSSFKDFFYYTRMQKDFFFPDEPRWTILLIDMQRDTPGIDTEKKSRLVAYQSKVLEYASTNDIPAVIAEVKGNGATIGELRNIAKNIGRKVKSV